jgi:hypothetical protein
VEDEPMNEIEVLAIDIAKWVLQLHGVDAAGHAQLRRQVRRVPPAKYEVRFAAPMPRSYGIRVSYDF